MTSVPSDLSFERSESTPPATTEPRPFYRSVRRELWENRFVYLAPLIVTLVVLFASTISLVGLPKKVRSLHTLDAAARHSVMVRTYSMAPAVILLATFLVGFFYCLDALYGERRDRSLLFWKSLPVSDRTTVLAKAAIPIVVLPLLGILLGQLTQAILLILSSAVLVMNGIGPAPLWAEFRFIQQPLVLFYGVSVQALWLAPLYAWLLLLSAWARRAPILWATFPPLGVAMVEKIVFGTTYFSALVKYRLLGAMDEAFVHSPRQGGVIDRLSQLAPGHFLASAGLWSGLALTALFLLAAMRLRRNRDPI